MTPKDYAALPIPMQPMQFQSTVCNASLNRETVDLVCQNANSFLALNCVDMNAFMQANRGSFLPMQVSSTVVLYAHGDKWTIFDFSTESPTWADRYRKLYNAVLNFERLNCRKLAEARSTVDYVLVEPQVSPKVRVPLDRRRPLAILHQHFDEQTPAPWEYDMRTMRQETVRIEHDMRRMSEYLVRKVFCVFPSELDQYARESGWSN